MTLLDVLIVVAIIVVVFFGITYYLNKKNMKKVIQAQEFIEQNKMAVQIFVIDKKIDKPTPANMTKAVYEQMSKTARMRKVPLVKAKVGPQIVTLMCDKSVYQILPVKKNVKVDLAGIYIVSIHGMNLADKKKKTLREKIAVQMDNSMKDSRVKSKK